MKRVKLKKLIDGYFELRTKTYDLRIRDRNFPRATTPFYKSERHDVGLEDLARLRKCIAEEEELLALYHFYSSIKSKDEENVEDLRFFRYFPMFDVGDSALVERYRKFDNWASKGEAISLHNLIADFDNEARQRECLGKGVSVPSMEKINQ